MGFRLVRRDRITDDPEAIGAEIIKVPPVTRAQIGQLYLDAKRSSHIFDERWEPYLEDARRIGEVVLFSDDPSEVAEAEAMLKVDDGDGASSAS